MNTHHFQNSRYSWLIDIIFLSLILSIFYFAFMGARPLLVPDEARYAEIAREMVVSHDYIIPHLNGVIYFEKPILLYWLTAAAIKLNGLSLVSVRLVNVILGVIGCLFSYAVASRLYGRLAGLLAGFMLATSSLYYFMAHIVNHDLTVTVFLAGCLYAFIIGVEKPMGMPRRLFMWAMAASAALAVLSKGLIGILLPVAIICLWLFFMNDLRALKKMYLPTSLLVFLFIAAPWHILVEMQQADFFNYYFIYQQFLRYLTPMARHVEPITFFIPILIMGFFPWVVFLPQAITDGLPNTWQERFKNKNEIFFMLWVVVIFIFFSISKCKLISYILPVMPPLTILTARYLALQADKALQLGLRIGFGFLVALSLLVGVAFISLTYFNVVPDAFNANVYLYSAAWILFIGSLIAVLYQWQRLTLYAITAVIISSSFFLMSTLKAVQYIDSRNILPLAVILHPLIKPTDEVVSFEKYYYDLPFYLQRRVTVVYHSDEFDFGIQHQATGDWMIDESTFWQRWRSQKRLYVVMNAKDYVVLKRRNPGEKFYDLARTLNDILVTNHPAEQSTQLQ